MPHLKHHRLFLTTFAALLLAGTCPTAEAGVAEAARAFNAGNYAGALQECQGPADSADADCAEWTGRTLLALKNPDRDAQKGLQYLQKAIEGGSQRAMNALASAYWGGEQLDMDSQAAVALWTRAAGLGNASARMELATLARNGWAMRRDAGKARELLEGLTDDMARINLAEMLLTGEGGARDAGRATALFTELLASRNKALAERAQRGLDMAQKLATADDQTTALYLNPFSPAVRKTLEGKLALRDAQNLKTLPLCWDDLSSKAWQKAAGSLIAGDPLPRLTHQWQQALTEQQHWSGPVNLQGGDCRQAAVLVLRQADAGAGGLNDPHGLTGPGGETRPATLWARTELLTLLRSALDEGRDRNAERFNDMRTQKETGARIRQAAASSKALFAALTTATDKGVLPVCTLAGQAAQVQGLVADQAWWKANGNGYVPDAQKAVQELPSADALYEAVTGKPVRCGLVLAEVDPLARLSAALERDKVLYHAYFNPAWTRAGAAEANARAKGFNSVEEQELAGALGASASELKAVLAAGVASPTALKAAQKRARDGAYPVALANSAALLAFLDDEASAKKNHKTAAMVAKERMAAEESKRKLQEAAAAEQRKRDERDHNAELLSTAAGDAGANACHAAAEDHATKVATYSHKWDDLCLGCFAFDKYLVKVETAGVLTMTSNHLLLQNGFGAFKRQRVYCEYDTRRKLVLNVLITNAND